MLWHSLRMHLYNFNRLWPFSLPTYLCTVISIELLLSFVSTVYDLLFNTFSKNHSITPVVKIPAANPDTGPRGPNARWRIECEPPVLHLVLTQRRARSCGLTLSSSKYKRSVLLSCGGYVVSICKL